MSDPKTLNHSEAPYISQKNSHAQSLSALMKPPDLMASR